MKHTKKGIESLPTKHQVETERKRYRRQKAYNKALGGTIYVLTMVAAVAVLIATLVLPVLQIEGTSMEPTLVNGDIVLLTKTTNFERGELCAFTWNNKLLIKRVIGRSGDWIEIDTDGTVYLNGTKLEEEYGMAVASMYKRLAKDSCYYVFTEEEQLAQELGDKYGYTPGIGSLRIDPSLSQVYYDQADALFQDSRDFAADYITKNLSRADWEAFAAQCKEK